VRVCVHAGNTEAEVDLLVASCVEWAKTVLGGEEREAKQGKEMREDREVMLAKARL
jgi:hypothetical protein